MSIRNKIPLIITITCVCLLQLSTSTVRVLDKLNVRCSFLDSVNITGAVQVQDGSYIYDGILYPPDTVDVFDYEFVNLTYKQSVKPHLRGCICSMKPCIKLCCPKNHYYDNHLRICVEPKESFHTQINITFPNKTVAEADIYNNTGQFGSIIGIPCEVGYFLSPQQFDGDDWEIYPNGTMYLLGVKYYSKDDYCMSPMHSENSTELVINPYICYDDFGQHPQHVLYVVAMLFSIPFMVITIIIYATIPELRNLHGKSLICYLSALTIGYSIISYIKYTNGRTITSIPCQIMGFTAYFFLLGSFFWLSVISFDLWWNFRSTKGMNKYREYKKFSIYSAYAWGMPLLMLGITISIQQSKNVEYMYKSGIDGIFYCWLNTTLWIQLAYFFGPLIVIIAFNTVMFAMTAMKIRKVQAEMTQIMAKEDSRRNLENEKDQFGLFLRLFVIMGVTWSMETISWLTSNPDKLNWVFYITDLCNGVQGFLIFALFVLKKKVKTLIIKRYRSIRGLPSKSSQCSSKTNSSNITMSTVQTNADKPERLMDDCQG